MVTFYEAHKKWGNCQGHLDVDIVDSFEVIPTVDVLIQCKTIHIPD